jgi:hypothetical protein
MFALHNPDKLQVGWVNLHCQRRTSTKNCGSGRVGVGHITDKTGLPRFQPLGLLRDRDGSPGLFTLEESVLSPVQTEISPFFSLSAVLSGK